MKLAWLGCLVGGLLFAGTQDSDVNVNRRYTVDSVIVAGKGWRADVAEPHHRHRAARGHGRGADSCGPAKVYGASNNLRRW